MLGQTGKNNINNMQVNWGKGVLIHPSRNHTKQRSHSTSGRSYKTERKDKLPLTHACPKLRWTEIAYLSKKSTKYLMNQVYKTVSIFTVLIASCLSPFPLPLLLYTKCSGSLPQLLSHCPEQLAPFPQLPAPPSFCSANTTFLQPNPQSSSSSRRLSRLTGVTISSGCPGLKPLTPYARFSSSLMPGPPLLPVPPVEAGGSRALGCASAGASLAAAVPASAPSPHIAGLREVF